MISEEDVARKWEAIGPLLGERSRRIWAATEAQALGWGGVAMLSRVTGLAANTIKSGFREIANPAGARDIEPGRSRRPGAGRPRTVDAQSGVTEALERLVSPETRGDPMSPLRWTSKSTRTLAAELQREGFSISAPTVGLLLREAGYSMQALSKVREGAQHPDRDAQFRFIQERVEQFQANEQPVVSIDCKKKELIGDFKNGGREWQPKREPEEVRSHDFKDKELGIVIPYGVYDVTRNEGWVSVGIDHETADFAGMTIRQWWSRMGKPAYPGAGELLIVADSGGANGSKRRTWKLAVQELDRASNVLSHHTELEGPTASESAGRREPHREDEDAKWSADQGFARHAKLPHRPGRDG
jgi:hypothetical protein